MYIYVICLYVNYLTNTPNILNKSKQDSYYQFKIYNQTSSNLISKSIETNIDNHEQKLSISNRNQI